MFFQAFLLTLAAAQSCRDIPFRWTPGQIEIEVSVSARRPVWFILDSGAEYSIIRTDIAEELGLTPERRMARDFVSDVSFDIGGVKLVRQDAMVLPLDNFKQQHRDIRGLIGYDFFATRAVTVDYETSRLRVCPAAVFRPAADDVAVALTFAGRVPVVHAVLTLADGREVPMRAMVDTGAQAPIIVRHPFAEAHGLLETAVDAASSPSLFGARPMKAIAARNVRVGPASLDVPSVKVFASNAGPGGFTETDALIGNELLRRARLTFDYARRRVLLAPVRK
jgi:predicted aspartyl protease